jgi:hypothetical protein
MAGKPINEILVCISQTGDGNSDEGVLVMNTTIGWMPMFEADAEKFDSLREKAKQCAKARGIAVKLVRFTTREELEIIE